MFLFFEIFFRVFLPQPTTLRAEALSPRVFEKSDYTPWKLKPLSMDRHISETGREFDVGVSINSYGLRDNEITYSELHNKTIIGAIGDSFTYGFGVELEESFHQVLEKLLIKDGKNVRVINMGRADGSNSQDIEYLYLKQKGIFFNPKLIIIGYYVGNDITDIGNKHRWESLDRGGNPTNISSDETFVDSQGRLRSTSGLYKANGSLFYKINRFMSMWSHSYVFIKRLYIGGFMVKPEPTHLYEYPAEFKTQLQLSEHLLSQTNDMLKSHNATLVVMFIPPETQTVDRIWEDYKSYFGDNAYRQNPQEELMGYCKQKKIKCLNLQEYYLNKPELYFKYDAHWTKSGHEIAGEKLYQYLLTEGLI